MCEAMTKLVSPGMPAQCLPEGFRADGRRVVKTGQRAHNPPAFWLGFNIDPVLVSVLATYLHVG